MVREGPGRRISAVIKAKSKGNTEAEVGFNTEGIRAPRGKSPCGNGFRAAILSRSTEVEPGAGPRRRFQ